MKPPALLWPIFLVVFPACKQHAEPAWAHWPERSIHGDPTITGDPAPVGRFSTPPVIDGKLDEAAWQTATALGPFVDVGGGADVKADHPVAAFARIGYDDQNLYLGFVVHDRSPVQPFDRDAQDPHVWGKSSAVEVMLQPGDPGDNRDYYEMQFDTKGAIFDSHFDDYNAPITGVGPDKIFGHQDWSCRAQRAALVDKSGFYAIEVAVPWSAFANARVPIPPHTGDIWRLELYSFRDGQRLSLGWSPIRGQGNFHKSARFGRIKFGP